MLTKQEMKQLRIAINKMEEGSLVQKCNVLDLLETYVKKEHIKLPFPTISVKTYSELPSLLGHITKLGDVYKVEDENEYYIRSMDGWLKIGENNE